MNASPDHHTDFLIPEMDGRTLEILMLDDNEIDRLRLKRLSEKAGLTFNCHEAHDLDSFRAQLDAQEMDLVFIDYHLDVDNGVDALHMLIAHEDQVDALPIMVTSMERHDVAVEAMRLGCADYIIKDQVTAESLRNAVASAFERKTLITALTNSRSAQQSIRSLFVRLALTSAPEISAVLMATMRKIRAMRSTYAGDAEFANNLASLELSCQQLHGFLNEIEDVMTDVMPANRPAPKRVIGK
ncbi:response regulator [Rhodobacterales bacterium HKCCE2091]|nr:response regulator [Rhodobacterales bacterium HKCCE2091]